MTNNFESLGVTPSIIEAIKEMDFETPTDVQQAVIPHVLKLKDLIVMAKTGSGKTGAFGIPMLQSIDPKGHGPRGLILTPTRELAVQVDQDLKKMAKYLDISTTVVYGQHDIRTEILALKSSAVVTGTPGRVFDHIKRKTLETRNIQFVVLDEADHMLDMGFYEQVVQIIKELPTKRVTMLFSATMPSEIKRICQYHMHQPMTIELQSETMTVDTVKQVYYRVQPNEKRTLLNRLLNTEQPDRCMIFCNTRDEVDRVQVYLSRNGYEAEALHGANTQNSRMKTIQKFKEGTLQLLVATDIAARGIHIDDLSLVVNYDVPMDKNSYVHRIGRTARAGNSGKAVTLVTSDDIMSLYEIEEHVGVLLEEVELPATASVKDGVEKLLPPRKPVSRVQSEHPRQMKPELSRQPRQELPRQPKLELPRQSKTELPQPKPELSRQPRPEYPRQPKPELSSQPQPERMKQVSNIIAPKVAPQETKRQAPVMNQKPKSEAPITKGKEGTVMTKKYGAVKVIYREGLQEKTSFFKDSKVSGYLNKLFKKDI